MVVIQRKRSNHSTPPHIPDSRKQCDEMAITETEGDCEDSDGPSRRKRKRSRSSGGFTPCRHLRPSSGREHTIVTYSVR